MHPNFMKTVQGFICKRKLKLMGLLVSTSFWALIKVLFFYSSRNEGLVKEKSESLQKVFKNL